MAEQSEDLIERRETAVTALTHEMNMEDAVSAAYQELEKKGIHLKSKQLEAGYK